MKLKRIRADQFAGINDIDVELSAGINLILGENESGKSTLVELIYQVLFKSDKLDGRKDKGFIEKYFPTRSTGGVNGDCIDATLFFEGSGGQYKLSREWDIHGETLSSLLLPDKTRLKNAAGIGEILKRELIFGKGIYNEVVFASQNREYAAIKHLMDGVSGASDESALMDELRGAVANAVLESGGVDISNLEKAIAEKIEEYGSNWDDLTRDGEPVGGKAKRGLSNPWKKNVGKVLEAYYSRELMEKELNKICAAEKAVHTSNERYKEAVKLDKEAHEKYESFAKYQGVLTSKQYIERSISEESAAIKRLKGVLPGWEKAEKEFDRLGKRSEKLEKSGVKREDYEEAEALEASVRDLRRKLGGLELLAGVKLKEGYNIEVRSAADGREIEISDGKLAINEAVIIKIPDVMEMTIAAADTDIDSINSKISEDKAKLDKILRRNKVKSLEELEVRYKTEHDERQELESAMLSVKAELVLYNKNYVSQKQLLQDLDKRQLRLNRLFDELSSLPGVPKEYSRIDDIESEEVRLKKASDRAREDLNSASRELAEALSVLGEKSQEECEEELMQAKENFEELRSTYRHWLHIMEVFQKLKNKNNTSDTNDIYERFKKYLSLLTDDGIKVAELDGEFKKFSMISRDKYIGYTHLSEGSKDTVSLAFRLAVLENLFPKGDAVVVFDDPFTDMDERRRHRACDLLKSFAEKNQVLFVSCNPNYEKLLGGNVIRL